MDLALNPKTDIGSIGPLKPKARKPPKLGPFCFVGAFSAVPRTFNFIKPYTLTAKPLNPKPSIHITWVLVKGYSLSHHNGDLQYIIWLPYYGNIKSLDPKP